MANLAERFDEYERILLVSPAVVRFSVLKRRLLDREGYIRARVELFDGGMLEFSEFWSGITESGIGLLGYSYHWQDEAGRLIKRWDSAKHHSELPDAPHHIHLSDGTVESNVRPPTLPSVLKEIESRASPAKQMK